MRQIVRARVHHGAIILAEFSKAEIVCENITIGDGVNPSGPAGRNYGGNSGVWEIQRKSLK
jgi:hypothetical protein